MQATWHMVGGGRLQRSSGYRFLWCTQKLVKVRKENLVNTGEGFSLNLGFRAILCSHEMDSVLFQVSQKNCVHQRILYPEMKENIAYFRSHHVEKDVEADTKLHDIHLSPDIILNLFYFCLTLAERPQSCNPFLDT